MYCITYVMGPVNIIAIYATLQSHSLYLGVNHCLIVKLCRHIMTRWLNGEKTISTVKWNALNQTLY